MKKLQNKIIVIVGPTASGKTALAVHLASIYNGEIISADSRQVYKYMDIGTGKDLKEYGKIKYHCIDLVHPKTEFNLAKYIKKANLAIKTIQNKNKIPILVGGTGLYINSIIKGYNLTPEKININLRKKLEQKSKQELQQTLLEINKNAQKQLNNSDWNNPYRLIRYIERAIYSCSVRGRHACHQNQDNNLSIQPIILGISLPKEILHQRIHQRIIDRIEKQGMIEEIYNLHHKHKIPWKRIISFGLEYKFIGEYIQQTRIGERPFAYTNNKLQNKINALSIATNQYAKRQLTWFKKDKNIIWLDGQNKQNLYKNAEMLIKKFLKK